MTWGQGLWDEQVGVVEAGVGQAKAEGVECWGFTVAVRPAGHGVVHHGRDLNRQQTTWSSSPRVGSEQTGDME